MMDCCDPFLTDTKLLWYGSSFQPTNENVSISEQSTIGLDGPIFRITNRWTSFTESEFRHIIAANDVP